MWSKGCLDISICTDHDCIYHTWYWPSPQTWYWWLIWRNNHTQTQYVYSHTTSMLFYGAKILTNLFKQIKRDSIPYCSFVLAYWMELDQRWSGEEVTKRRTGSFQMTSTMGTITIGSTIFWMNLETEFLTPWLIWLGRSCQLSLLIKRRPTTWSPVVYQTMSSQSRSVETPALMKLSCWVFSSPGVGICLSLCMFLCLSIQHLMFRELCIYVQSWWIAHLWLWMLSQFKMGFMFTCIPLMTQCITIILTDFLKLLV